MIQSAMICAAVLAFGTYYFAIYAPTQVRQAMSVSPLELRDALAVLGAAGGIIEYDEGVPPFSHIVARRAIMEGLVLHAYLGLDPSATRERLELTDSGRRLLGIGAQAGVDPFSQLAALSPTQ